MSLDALTDGELEALLVYNLGMIAGEGENWRQGTSLANWPRRKAAILKAIERIDRILAFKRVA